MLRLEQFGPYVLAGLSRRHALSFDPEEMYFRVSGQWREFAEDADQIPALPPRYGYGICLGLDVSAMTMDYFSGVVVAGRDRIPAVFSALELPVLHCAVFPHHGHVSRIGFTLETIFRELLPVKNLRLADGQPQFIERYGEDFDPETGVGGLELLIPVKE